MRLTSSQDREILRLAVPAFFALVSEPLMLLADSAIVGHLGTPQLAALGIAGTILQTLVGVCVFLAYGTTSAVARRIGAGDHKGALAQGIDGLWLALLLGVVLAVVGVLLAPAAIGAFNPSPDVADHAVIYLRISCLGIPSMLLLLAATGVLRGLQDTKTPMIVAITANLLNIVLNLILVYGLDLDIAGSALGTALAQTAAGVALVVVVVRGARRDGAKLRPDFPASAPRPTPAYRWWSGPSRCGSRSSWPPSSPPHSVRRPSRPIRSRSRSGRSWPSRWTRSRSPRRR